MGNRQAGERAGGREGSGKRAADLKPPLSAPGKGRQGCFGLLDTPATGVFAGSVPMLSRTANPRFPMFPIASNPKPEVVVGKGDPEATKRGQWGRGDPLVPHEDTGLLYGGEHEPRGEVHRRIKTAPTSPKSAILPAELRVATDRTIAPVGRCSPTNPMQPASNRKPTHMSDGHPDEASRAPEQQDADCQ